MVFCRSDIAFDLGFSSHEHFSRNFKDTFGMTPDEYRKNPMTLNRMTKPLPKHELQTDVFCAERYASHSPETTNMELWQKLMD